MAYTDYFLRKLSAALGSLGDEFEEFTPGFLAHLALTSKPERMLCRALANRLQGEFRGDIDTRVAREWPTPESRLKKVDVAILRAGRPTVLIEAKAAIASDLVKGTGRGFPRGAVVEDVEKLLQIDADDRYALLFVSHPRQEPGKAFDWAMPYAHDFHKYGVIKRSELKDGFKRLLRALGDDIMPVTAVTCGSVAGGTAFGAEVEVLYWLLQVSAEGA